MCFECEMEWEQMKMIERKKVEVGKNKGKRKRASKKKENQSEWVKIAHVLSHTRNILHFYYSVMHIFWLMLSHYDMNMALIFAVYLLYQHSSVPRRLSHYISLLNEKMIISLRKRFYLICWVKKRWHIQW